MSLGIDVISMSFVNELKAHQLRTRCSVIVTTTMIRITPVKRRTCAADFSTGIALKLQLQYHFFADQRIEESERQCYCSLKVNYRLIFEPHFEWRKTKVCEEASFTTSSWSSYKSSRLPSVVPSLRAASWLAWHATKCWLDLMKMVCSIDPLHIR